MSSLKRKAERASKRRLVNSDPKLIKQFCETEKYVQLAESIVREKVGNAIEEMTREQAIHEIRVTGCVSAVWMLALKDVFGFHAVRLNRAFQRVHEILAYMNENKLHDQNVLDVIEAVRNECGIQIEVPKGVNDRRPLLLGGRSVCYGPMLGTVQIMGHDIEVKAETVGTVKIDGDSVEVVA